MTCCKTCIRNDERRVISYADHSLVVVESHEGENLALNRLLLSGGSFDDLGVVPLGDDWALPVGAPRAVTLDSLSCGVLARFADGHVEPQSRVLDPD